jgi:hypothetical protein
MVSWIVFAGVIVFLVVGAFFWIRSEKRWQPPPPTTPEAKQAEAELWSTRNLPQR